MLSRRWQSRRTCTQSSPARTSKLQLAADQPSTGDCWIPTKKDTPHLRAKEQDGRRGKITFRIKPRTHQRCSEGSNKTCVHQQTLQRLSQTCRWVCQCLMQMYRSTVTCRGGSGSGGSGSGCSRPGCGISPFGGGCH